MKQQQEIARTQKPSHSRMCEMCWSERTHTHPKPHKFSRKFTIPKNRRISKCMTKHYAKLIEFVVLWFCELFSRGCTKIFLHIAYELRTPFDDPQTLLCVILLYLKATTFVALCGYGFESPEKRQLSCGVLNTLSVTLAPFHSLISSLSLMR